MENIFTKQIKRLSEVSDIKDRWEIESLASDYVNTIGNINDRTSSATQYVNNVSKDALIKKIESSGGVNSDFSNNLKLERDFLRSQYNNYVKYNNEVTKYSNSLKTELNNIEKKMKAENKTSQEILNAKTKLANQKIRVADPTGYTIMSNSLNSLESFKASTNKSVFLSNWNKQKKKTTEAVVHAGYFDTNGNFVKSPILNIKNNKQNFEDYIRSYVVDPLLARDMQDAGSYLSPTEGINTPTFSPMPQENETEVKESPEATESPETDVSNIPNDVNFQLHPLDSRNSGVSPMPKQSTTEVPKASPGAKISPETPQIYRIREAGSEVDSIYDAKTGEKIESIDRFKADYQAKGAVEVDAPDSVKQIYRDGEKIFDAKTNKQILNEEELKNYANAVEIDKPSTDNIREYAPKGTKADNQEYLSEGDVKILEERQAQSPDKPSEKIYSEAMKETGEKEVLTSDKPVRKFTRILRDENGNIKTENGKPQYEDYYLPVYTKEELANLSDEKRTDIINKVKEKFISKGGTEETWASSQEFQAVNDTLEKEVSGDELYRAGEYAARYASTEAKLKEEAINKARSLAGADWDKLTDDEKNTKIEENLKEIKVKNNMGADVNYNISEEVLFNPVEKEKEDKPETPADTNPWAANAEAAKTVEAPKFVKTVDDSMEDKKQAYRKITKGRIEGQE